MTTWNLDALRLSLPCPWCGGTWTDSTVHTAMSLHAHGWWYYLWCQSCLVQGPHASLPEEALARWNTRWETPQP